MKKSKIHSATDSQKVVKLQQIKSPIGRPKCQRQTLIGLKLNKIGRISTLCDTLATQGMIAKVAHLIRVLPT